jgi:hypothetical protein
MFPAHDALRRQAWSARARQVSVMSSNHREFVFLHPEEFGHDDACRLVRWALSRRELKTVVVDLYQARDATTSAFAHLVLLRRELLRTGRDLRLANLRERAAKVYEVNRLAGVLPRERRRAPRLV